MAQHAPLAGDWLCGATSRFAAPASRCRVWMCSGPGEESERLRAIARDPRFREAVTWQNPAALANAIDKVADGAPAKPSRVRQREEIVASYWQRYCSKNDTIGFFGPLAWGRIVDDGAPRACARRARARARGASRGVARAGARGGARSRAEDRDRPAGRGRPAGPARSARRCRALRERGLAALDGLVAARDAVAAAGPEVLRTRSRRWTRSSPNSRARADPQPRPAYGAARSPTSTACATST